MEKRELVYYRLDKIDGKILDILQGNARASLKEIAEQVFLSPTAVGARIDRMLQEGVLEGFKPQLYCFFSGSSSLALSRYLIASW